MIIKSVGTAHQYLSKPSDPETIKETVNKACALRNLLKDEKLRKLVSQMNTVPSLPHLYSELIKELEQTEPRTDKIIQIVKQDIGMTVKILQIVNSAFFGLRRNLTDVGQAIKFLGLDTIKSLSLGIGIFSQFERSNLSNSTISQLWSHSISVGRIARSIAEQINPSVAGDSFTAGLLHDIGEVVLAVNMPEKFLLTQSLVDNENYTRTDSEKEIFDTTHSEVGAYLIGLWGLPRQVVEAVAFHHQPSDFHCDSFTPLTAVHIANAINRYKDENIAAEPEKFLDVKCLENLGLIEHISIWQEKYNNVPDVEL